MRSEFDSAARFAYHRARALPPRCYTLMVRVLLVRHAQSMQNAYMEGVAARISRGELAPTELNKAMRDAPENMDAGADAPLTAKGAAQAELLGEAWAPLLAERARAGKLKLFVSPFLRTLGTADPLMKRLTELVPSFSATLLPAIMEKGGLTAPENFRNFDTIDAMTRAGKRAEAMEFLKAIEWQPMGMSGEEIEQLFPWSRSAAGEDDLCLPGDVTVPRDDHWWHRGYESTKAAATRVAEVVTWLERDLREDVPGDTVVVLVTHGGTIAALVEALLGFSEELSADGIRNTSVTSLLMPSTSASAAMPNIGGSTGQVRSRPLRCLSHIRPVWSLMCHAAPLTHNGIIVACALHRRPSAPRSSY
jgi:broad specificity phosphatase PhoE